MFNEDSLSDLERMRRAQILRSTILLLLLIGAVEVAVMLLIHPLGVPDIAEAAIDAVLLVIILIPFIYRLLVRQAVSETENSLIASLQLSDDLVRAMPAGIFIYDFIAPDRLILADGNIAAEHMTGRALSDWKGKDFDEIWPSAKDLGITEKFLHVAQTGTPFEEDNLVYKDHVLIVDTMVHVFTLPNNRLAVSFVDITERKLAEEELRRSKDKIQAMANDLEQRVEERTLSLQQLNVQLSSEIEERREVEQRLAQLNKELQLLSYQDGLTGVANRRMFDELLEKEWRRCQRNKKPLALIMFDIDYFKQYNDCYGHQLGDACLKQVAQALTDASQRPADLLARYGGEEFALLLPETDREHALVLAEKARELVLEKKIEHKPSKANDMVSVSCGVFSCVPDVETELVTLIEQADKALYRAKESGRNRVACL